MNLELERYPGELKELRSKKISVDCNTCENRGALIPLAQETYCENCIYGSPWKKNYYKEKNHDKVFSRCGGCLVVNGKLPPTKFVCAIKAKLREKNA
jgi:hypothetical protein